MLLFLSYNISPFHLDSFLLSWSGLSLAKKNIPNAVIYLETFLLHQSLASVYFSSGVKILYESVVCLVLPSGRTVFWLFFFFFFCQLLHFLPGYTCFIEVTAVVLCYTYFGR